MQEVRKCVICGEFFIVPSRKNRSITCSLECKKERAERKKVIPTYEKKNLRLIEVNRKAKEAGMSYGKYVAMLKMMEEKNEQR